MPERAHVTSIDALESFRASLIIYLAKARPVLEEVAADVVRTRLWLENDQRTYWENQVRSRARKVEEAKAHVAEMLAHPDFFEGGAILNDRLNAVSKS